MSKSHILIVDDEEALVKSIERALRKEYLLSVAYDGQQGVQVAQQVKPNLIILDIFMPEMDGYQACRALRKDPELKSIPILFLTALSTIESKISGFEAGADDYLTKPFDIRELMLRVKAMLRRASIQNNPDTTPEAILTYYDLVLNKNTYEVTTTNGIHHLTPIEFDLLHYLIKNAGQVLSSNQLLDGVWGYSPYVGSPGLVRTHIRNLRTKIESDPANPVYLKTVPRHGYILDKDDE